MVLREWEGFLALQTVSWLPDDIFVEDPTGKHKQLVDKPEAFGAYLRNNAGLIPSYGERYRYGVTLLTHGHDAVRLNDFQYPGCVPPPAP